MQCNLVTSFYKPRLPANLHSLRLAPGKQVSQAESSTGWPLNTWLPLLPGFASIRVSTQVQTMTCSIPSCNFVVGRTTPKGSAQGNDEFKVESHAPHVVNQEVLEAMAVKYAHQPPGARYRDDAATRCSKWPSTRATRTIGSWHLEAGKLAKIGGNNLEFDRRCAGTGRLLENADCAKGWVGSHILRNKLHRVTLTNLYMTTIPCALPLPHRSSNVLVPRRAARTSRKMNSSGP